MIQDVRYDVFSLYSQVPITQTRRDLRKRRNPARFSWAALEGVRGTKEWSEEKRREEERQEQVSARVEWLEAAAAAAAAPRIHWLWRTVKRDHDCQLHQHQLFMMSWTETKFSGLCDLTENLRSFFFFLHNRPNRNVLVWSGSIACVGCKRLSNTQLSEQLNPVILKITDIFILIT